MFDVTVPATSANLGPGFDTLGIALRLRGRFLFEEVDRPTDSKHLAHRAYRKTLRWLGERGPALRVRSAERIPVGKGLGSSAACIIAGVLAAGHVSGRDLTMEERLFYAARMEGHPDNVAPALLGGLVVSGWQEEKLLTGRFQVSDRLSFALLTPSFGLPTTKARQVLPQRVPFQDAVYNLSQLGLSLSALIEGDEELVRRAFGDRLHQPVRFPLVEGAEELAAFARCHGALAVTLSGAGPSLLLIRKKDDPLHEMQEALTRMENPWELHLVDVDMEGATLNG